MSDFYYREMGGNDTCKLLKVLNSDISAVSVSADYWLLLLLNIKGFFCKRDYIP